MQAEFISSVFDVPEQEWNALWPGTYPFTRHAFFAALEQSRSVSGQFNTASGWQSHHLVLRDNTQLIALLPLFIKSHSYGEYVFDWGWADAYHQHGLDYYPKLINAIPFTPASGARWALAATLDAAQKQHCLEGIKQALASELQRLGLSGLHSLFPPTRPAFMPRQSHQRLGVQYHWFNRNYTNFDDFLATFASRKRKNLLKERRKVTDSGLRLAMRPASQIAPGEWDAFYLLYHNTYLKRSGRSGYLGASFFHELARAMPEQVLLASAHDGSELIAAALYLRDEDTLYGRYWGAREEIDGLHFECCYYQGIDYAIAHKLRRFDPGAQGEHKIQRGFTPIKTQSFHYLGHPDFNNAVGDFVRREATHIEAYIDEARRALPFKEGIELVPVNSVIHI